MQVKAVLEVAWHSKTYRNISRISIFVPEHKEKKKGIGINAANRKLHRKLYWDSLSKYHKGCLEDSYIFVLNHKYVIKSSLPPPSSIVVFVSANQ